MTKELSLREFNFTFFPINARKGWTESLFKHKRIFLLRFIDFSWRMYFNCYQRWKRNSIKRKLHNWAIKWKDNNGSIVEKSSLMTLEETEFASLELLNEKQSKGWQTCCNLIQRASQISFT